MADVGWTLWTSGWSSDLLLLLLLLATAVASRVVAHSSLEWRLKKAGAVHCLFISRRARCDRTIFQARAPFKPPTGNRIDVDRLLRRKSERSFAAPTPVRRRRRRNKFLFFFNTTRLLLQKRFHRWFRAANFQQSRGKKILREICKRESDSVCACVLANWREKEWESKKVTPEEWISLTPSIFYLEIGQPPLSTNFLPSFLPPLL